MSRRSGQPGSGRLRAGAVCLLLCLTGAAVRAQAEPGACASDLTGSLRPGYWTRAGDFQRARDPVVLSAWLQASVACGPMWSVKTEGVLASEDAWRGRGGASRWREAYLSWHGAPDWTVKVGRQLIVWGRADRLNPTDNLSPRNFTRLVAEETDQRDGVDALTVGHRSEAGSLTALVSAPSFRPSVLPMDLPAGLSRREVPQRAWQAALKLDRSGGDVEWSVSWLRGRDLLPSYAPNVTPQGRPVLRLTHPAVQVLGADVATVAGRYGLRAEAAYTWVDRDGATDVFTRKSMFYGVAGIDRTFDNDLNVNAQWFWRHVHRHEDAGGVPDPMAQALLQQAMASWNQTRRDQYGMSLRLARKWLNETVEAEVAGVFSFVAHEYALRPRLTWHVNDRFRLTLGADRFRGGPNTFFGQVKDLSSVFVEGRIGF